jgi:hypothetical protein
MNIDRLLDLLIYVGVLTGVFWVLYWLLGKIAPPEPWNKIFQIILAIAVAVIAIDLLRDLYHGGVFSHGWR